MKHSHVTGTSGRQFTTGPRAPRAKILSMSEEDFRKEVDAAWFDGAETIALGFVLAMLAAVIIFAWISFA